MKQVIVQAFCDGDHAESTPAVNERTVAIDGSDSILLDVCEQCDQLFAVLLTFMERGAKVEKTKPKKQQKKQKVSDGPIKVQPPEGKRASAEDLPTTCPDCGFHSVSRTALGQHMRTKHEKGFKDFSTEQMNAAEVAWASGGRESAGAA